MELFGINAVSREIGIHQSSLGRWEAMGFIVPARIDMGKTTVRIYSSADVDLLSRAKGLMNEGIQLRTAFEWARMNFDEEERP